VRLFVAPARLVAGELTIDGDEHNYVMRARRSRVGDAVEIVDGAGRAAVGTITKIGSDTTIITVGAPAEIVARPPWIRVLVPPIKGDRMDVCLEKLVEVGADEIVVWPAARAVVRLEGDKRETRVAKYQAAARAAARQSGRAAVPSIRAATSLVDAMAGSSGFVLDPASDAPLMNAFAPGAPAPAVVTIASGPEGGFAPDELDVLAAAGFASASLGPRVLRAETAPVVAVALIRAATAS
jgi:16S rRNA (uracil1498-N3)-methyltransferase